MSSLVVPENENDKVGSCNLSLNPVTGAASDMSTGMEFLRIDNAKMVNEGERRTVAFEQKTTPEPDSTCSISGEAKEVDEKSPAKSCRLMFRVPVRHELDENGNEDNLKKRNTFSAISLMPVKTRRRRAARMRNTVGSIFGGGAGLNVDSDKECVTPDELSAHVVSPRGRGRKSKPLNAAALSASTSTNPIQKRPRSLSKGPRRGRDRFRGVGVLFSTSAKRRGPRPPARTSLTHDGTERRNESVKTSALATFVKSKRVVSPSPARKTARGATVDDTLVKFCSYDTAGPTTEDNSP
jgi:hypothetical protein